MSFDQQSRFTKGSFGGMSLPIVNTHTQPFNGSLSRTTRVNRYRKKPLPTHTHEEEGFAQTTRSIAWELIPFMVLWASEGC